MYLMRTGAPGAEKPAARVDGEHYVDLSDVVTDFDEAFFAGGGIERHQHRDGGEDTKDIRCDLHGLSSLASCLPVHWRTENF